MDNFLSSSSSLSCGPPPSSSCMSLTTQSMAVVLCHSPTHRPLSAHHCVLVGQGYRRSHVRPRRRELVLCGRNLPPPPPPTKRSHIQIYSIYSLFSFGLSISSKFKISKVVTVFARFLFVHWHARSQEGEMTPPPPPPPKKRPNPTRSQDNPRVIIKGPKI